MSRGVHLHNSTSRFAGLARRGIDSPPQGAFLPDHRYDRRRFMTVTGAALAGFAGAPSLAASAISPRDATQVGVTHGRDPELIAVNGTGHTRIRKCRVPRRLP